MEDECPYCQGRGFNYPYGHEDDEEYRQPCWACSGSGTSDY